MGELAKKEINQVAGDLSPLVRAAMNGDLDTSKLSELLEIQKAYEANEAKKAFYQSLAKFKETAPIIKRDKKVAYSSTSYSHSSLGYSLSEVVPLLSNCDLSLAWETNQNNGQITVTCVLSHILGHSIRTSLSSAPDTTGGKNSIQAIGSAVTYLERYTAFAILGLASSDDDDGVKTEPKPKITAAQAQEIEAKIKDNGINMTAFLAWLKKSIKVDSIEEINANMYQDVERMIHSKIKQKESAA